MGFTLTRPARWSDVYTAVDLADLKAFETRYRPPGRDAPDWERWLTRESAARTFGMPLTDAAPALNEYLQELTGLRAVARVDIVPFPFQMLSASEVMERPRHESFAAVFREIPDGLWVLVDRAYATDGSKYMQSDAWTSHFDELASRFESISNDDPEYGDVVAAVIEKTFWTYAFEAEDMPVVYRY